MRKISANIIITNTGKPLINGIIEIDDLGYIHKVTDTKGQLKEVGNLEFYNGIIVPGFVNAHCHLELSHMKGILSEGKGLPNFIREIINQRFSPKNLQEQIKTNDKKMQAEGIVACGDISNTNDTISTKLNSTIYYHTFAEVFTIGDELPETAFARGETLISELNKEKLPGTIVPHAPYSVPEKLFQKIAKQTTSTPIVSIHNQETESENTLFLTQKGELNDVLSYKNSAYEGFNFKGKNSLQTTLPYLPNSFNILLIHNTFTGKEDIDFAEKYSPNIYWVLCPKSNIYIENRLPNVPLFFENKIKICIGTDSLASNNTLSILDELKTIQTHFPEISLERLIFAATKEGANALGLANILGSIEKTKAPGLNLLTGANLQNLTLNANTKVKVLVTNNT